MPPMVTNAELRADSKGACRNCHDDQFEMYKQSYHGELRRGGCRGRERARNASTATEPTTSRKWTPRSIDRTSWTSAASATADVSRRILDTYHGKAITLGREASATCVDCHGDHSILPQSATRSPRSFAGQHPGHLPACHPDCARRASPPSWCTSQPTSPSAPCIVFSVALFYIVMIVRRFRLRRRAHAALHLPRPEGRPLLPQERRALMTSGSVEAAEPRHLRVPGSSTIASAPSTVSTTIW